MAKNARTPRKATTAAPDVPRELIVDRDMRFMRVAADDIFVVGRVNDIQLSVIEQGPRPVRVRPPTDVPSDESVGTGQLGLEASYTEIVRVIVQPNAAVAMAFQVLLQALRSEQLESAILRQMVTTMLDLFESEATKQGIAEVDG